MNTFKHLSFIICAAIGLVVAACEMAIPPFIGPTDRPVGSDSTIVVAPDSLIIPEEAKEWNIPAEAIDVLQAREICANLENGATSGTKYYVMGYVKKIHSKHTDGVTNYGNAQFYMENVQGANSSEDFMAFQVYGPNGQRINDVASVEVGDFVVIYGELTNYSGTYETVGKGAAYIWKSTNPLLAEPSTQPSEPEVLVIPEEAKAWNIPAEAIDVLQAREICAGLAAGDSTEEKYYVMGYVKKLHNNHETGVTGYGNAQFYMENVKGKNSSYDFIAFQVFGLNGEKITDPAAVAVGDFVVVYGKLTNYMGNTYETVGKGSAYIWNSTNPLLLPQPKEVVVLDQDLSTSASVNTFDNKNLTGTEKWTYNRSGKCVKIDGKGNENEDWFISPEIDLAGALEASLAFEHKFSVAPTAADQEHYTVWISKDYNGEDPKAATWVPITGIEYNAVDWVNMDNLTIPTEMLNSKCRIAWKYSGVAASAWNVRKIVVKEMVMP